MKKFIIPAGTKCQVRRFDQSDKEWRPHQTNRELTFGDYVASDNGGTWVFLEGEWFIKIPPGRVVKKKTEPERKRGWLPTGFNKCILGRNGRGASRRRAQRRRR